MQVQISLEFLPWDFGSSHPLKVHITSYEGYMGPRNGFVGFNWKSVGQEEVDEELVGRFPVGWLSKTNNAFHSAKGTLKL
jgi:hypothetical protein